MKKSKRSIGYLIYVVLVTSLLVSSWQAPAAAQWATPIADVPDQGSPNSINEALPEDSGLVTDDEWIIPDTSTPMPGSPATATNLMPLETLGEITTSDVPHWLVVYPPRESVTPNSSQEYYFNITNMTTSADHYYVWMRATGGGSISLAGIDQFYDCESLPNGYQCMTKNKLSPFNTHNFWFNVDVDSAGSHQGCVPPVEVTVEIVFMSNLRADYEETLTPDCSVTPTITMDAIILDQARHEVSGSARVGDTITYELGVSNPGTEEAITVGSFSKSIDPALIPLGWTVDPASALSPEGPCSFSSGVLTCSSVNLDPGEDFYVALVSNPIPEDTNACSTFTSSASIADGATSNAVSVTIECPQKEAEYPTLGMGSFTCAGSSPMIPLTISGGKYINPLSVEQHNEAISPAPDGSYLLREGIETSINLATLDAAIWPGYLPDLYDGGSWLEDGDLMIYRFTPTTDADCSPSLQITQTLVDANGSPLPGEPNFAPGSDIYIRVEVTNSGASTITGLAYESMLPPSLYVFAGQVSSPSIAHSDGQTCRAEAADAISKGVIHTVFIGGQCTMFSPNVMKPGDTRSFTLWARAPATPSAEQCAHGISTAASITRINAAAFTISSAPMRISIACQESPVVPPTTQVRIQMVNDESIEGALWKLYGATASQIGLPIYDQGIVGPGNLIVFNNETPAGTYRLVIEPVGMEVIDRTIEIESDTTEIVLQVDTDPEEEIPAETPAPTPTPAPTETLPLEVVTPTESPQPTVPVNPAVSPSATLSTGTQSPAASATVTETAASMIAPDTQIPVENTSSDAVVTGLPETGNQGDSGHARFVVAGQVLVSLLIMAFGCLRKSSLR